MKFALSVILAVALSVTSVVAVGLDWQTEEEIGQVVTKSIRGEQQRRQTQEQFRKNVSTTKKYLEQGPSDIPKDLYDKWKKRCLGKQKTSKKTNALVAAHRLPQQWQSAGNCARKKARAEMENNEFERAEDASRARIAAISRQASLIQTRTGPGTGFYCIGSRGCSGGVKIVTDSDGRRWYIDGNTAHSDGGLYCIRVRNDWVCS